MLMKKFFCELGYNVGDKVRCAQAAEGTAYEVGQVYELIPYNDRNVEWPTIYIGDTYLNGIGASWIKVHEWNKGN